MCHAIMVLHNICILLRLLICISYQGTVSENFYDFTGNFHGKDYTVVAIILTAKVLLMGSFKKYSLDQPLGCGNPLIIMPKWVVYT